MAASEQDRAGSLVFSGASSDHSIAEMAGLFVTCLQRQSGMPGCGLSPAQGQGAAELLGKRGLFKRSRMEDMPDVLAGSEEEGFFERSPKCASKFEKGCGPDEVSPFGIVAAVEDGIATPRYRDLESEDMLPATPCSQSVKRRCSDLAALDAACNPEEPLYTPCTPRFGARSSLNPFAWSSDLANKNLATPAEQTRAFWLPSSAARFSSQASPAILATTAYPLAVPAPMSTNAAAATAAHLLPLTTPVRPTPRCCLLTDLFAATELATIAVGETTWDETASSMLSTPAHSASPPTRKPVQSMLATGEVPPTPTRIRTPRPIVATEAQLIAAFGAEIAATITPTSRPLTDTYQLPPLTMPDAAAVAAMPASTCHRQVCQDTFLQPGLRLKAPRPSLDARIKTAHQDFFMRAPALRV